MRRAFIILAALALAAAFVLPTTLSAQDLGPVVTGGTQPWRNLTGTVTSGQTIDLMTVPEDRVFILTGGCVQNGTNAQEIDLRTGPSGVTVVDGSTTVLLCNPGSGNTPLFAAGKAHVVFDPNTTIQLSAGPTLGFTAAYYFEGYLAHP